jgi:molybdate transport system ATP-binding protein
MKTLDVDLQGNVGGLSIDVAFSTSESPLTIIGPNGAGKTSVLLMILGGLKPRDGRVAVGGTVVYEPGRSIDVPVERRRIGFLPQRYALFPHLDVVDNVAYGIRAASLAERREQAREALRGLDAETLGTRRPSELSGGESQRVALARALASRPQALLLDEPMAALDVSLRRDVRQFLADHLRALKLPTVVVTHDPTDVEILDGEVIVLERGSVVQRGRLSDLSARPATAFVGQFAATSSTSG